MKKIAYKILNLSLTIICVAAFVSCDREENLDTNRKIVGLGGEVTEPTDIDNWLMKNFVEPYNVEVKYKWDQFELDLNATLVPPREEFIIPIMSIVKDVWIAPYEEMAGSAFIKKLCPKKYVLVGSPRYNSSGTITLGEAEGGRKISIFRINWYKKGDRELVQSMMKTVHHEFTHTMHQTIMYPEEYMNITPGGYTSSWNNVSDETAMKLGFISPYASAAPDEDFCEMLSRILVLGKAAFDKYVEDARAIYKDPEKNAGLNYDPGDALRQKEAMLVTYLKDVWGIDLYDPSPNVKGLETLVQEAIERSVN